MGNISIVIGSWGSYNECNERALGSNWLDLSDYNDWEEIVEELKRESFELDGIDEELFIQDIEGIYDRSVNWDYMNPENLFNTLYESGVLTNDYKYTVGWHAEGLTNQRCWYEYGEWGWTTDDMFDPYAPIVNREYILEKFPEYKYSAIDKYTGIDVFKYLRLFEQYPQIEYLTKLGLHNLAMSKQILKKCGQDKRFCKWLAQNKSTLNKSSLYIPVVLQAYKKNRNVLEVQTYYSAKLKMSKDTALEPLRIAFKKDLEKFFHYLSKQRTNAYS